VDSVNRGMNPCRHCQLFLLATVLLTAAPLHAAVVVVTLTGISDSQGQVACALFPSSIGFPMEPAQAMRQQQPAKPGAIEFRFEDVKPGTYAVSASHDRNSNGKTDRNFVGIPTEPWGVSQNARPKMRAPKFDEAAFAVAEGQTVRIEIRVEK
jgi:uncharacterized protein (DUF2141 family)